MGACVTLVELVLASETLRGDLGAGNSSSLDCRSVGTGGELVLRVGRVEMRSGAERDGLRLVEARFWLVLVFFWLLVTLPFSLKDTLRMRPLLRFVPCDSTPTREN